MPDVRRAPGAARAARRMIRPARQRAALDLDQLRGMRHVRSRSFSPLDEELGLLAGELSATLAEGVVRFGTRIPFERAATELVFFWNVELDETTVRRYTEAAGAVYVAEQAAELESLERERSPAPEGPAVRYLSADAQWSR